MQPIQHAMRAVAVLSPGTMHNAGEQKSIGVYQEVALASGNLLSCVVAIRIPLLPAVFTLWVSSTPAVGLFFRPCFSRVCSRSTS